MSKVFPSPPDSIRIGPFDIDIIPLTVQQSDDSGRWGEFSSRHQNIKFCVECDPIVALDTFIHEVLHAVHWSMNIQEGANEEAIVSSTATGLTGVFRDNPELLPWMSRVLKMKA